MNIGLFGGTFSPPHNGHLVLAQKAYLGLKLDRLVLMPTGMPPHKKLPENSPRPEQRLHMTTLLEKALRNMGVWAETSCIEFERKGASYTSDTLRMLKSLYPQDTLYLIVGGDMFRSLNRWHEAEVIFSLAQIGAAARDKEEWEQLVRQKAFCEKEYHAHITLLQGDILELSSTEIRQAVREKRGHLLVPPEILSYIEREGLYQC